MRLKTAAVRIAGIRTRTTAGESLNCDDGDDDCGDDGDVMISSLPSDIAGQQHRRIGTMVEKR